MGDLIINEAIMKEMEYLFDKSFTIRFGTHNPILHHLQLLRSNGISSNCNEADYKFLGGTNLFKSNLLKLTPGWNVNLLTSSIYRGSIAIGCGVGGDADQKLNPYTKEIYKRALSGEYIHSVRDLATKKFLERLGFQAYDTGCPTLWGFSPELNSSIPLEKADKVVFTLTDYTQDPVNDQNLINILNSNYGKVYFWVQGSGDLKYLKQFSNINEIEIVNPNLNSYRKVLNAGDIDYVGTRLHAGIYAMQHSVRAIILAVDNRAREMHDSHNLVVVERESIGTIESMIKSSFSTDVRIDRDLIDKWKGQFQATN